MKQKKNYYLKLEIITRLPEQFYILNRCLKHIILIFAYGKFKLYIVKIFLDLFISHLVI